jgi:hypothetical protein
MQTIIEIAIEEERCPDNTMERIGQEKEWMVVF